MRAAVFSLLAVALAAAAGATGATSAAAAKKPAAVPDELIVGFETGVSESAQADALADAGATKKKSFEQIHAHLVRGPESKIASIEKALRSDPRVAYVEPNHVLAVSAIPDDPSFGQLWGLNNTGQTGGTPDDDVDAPEAWDLEHGRSSVVVAVVDTGVDFSHPDLAPQQWVNTGENCGSSDPTSLCTQASNGVDDDRDGYVDDWRGWDWVSNDNNPFDDHAHGTHVSGTIGAVGDNGVGVAGMNWNVKIMALKFLDSTGNGNTAGAISATLFAADHGARIASNSWGGGPFDQALLNAIDYGASKGMLFVAAAGNDGVNNDSTPTYPASYDSPAVVAVAATDSDDTLASFSNYGAKTVDLAAPGVGILSTTPGNTYSSFSGTSMATPHVSGAAALVAAHFPNATLYGTKALLMSTVDAKSTLSNRVVSGGRLNVFDAVSCASTPEVEVVAPATGFVAGLGDSLPVKIVGARCAGAAGLANVTVTVNGSPLTLAAASPDRGLYTGFYPVTATGPISVTASVSAGGSTATKTVTGTAAENYTCTDVSSPWVDVTPGTKLTTASNSDDNFSTLAIGFPFTYYGQTYTTAYVSSNGFVTLGSSNGADAFANTALPTSSVPNAVLAPFWDDLNPASTGDVYAGITGGTGQHALHVEWFNVPHFSLSGSGTATFEMSLYEATGKITYRWLDTDLGSSSWNAGASATAGVENTAGTAGRQISFEQPLLTSGRATSCTLTTAPPPPPPPQPSITTSSVPDATNGAAYSGSLAASGGTPPYTWSLGSGSLPSGVTLQSSTGALTGTPSDAAGTYSFTASVVDAASQSATKTLSLELAEPLGVTTATLADGTVGNAYADTVAATGGKSPYQWSIATGTLPDGLTLDSATGAISGTPTSTGTSAFTVHLADAAHPARTASASLAITVAGELVVTTTGLPGGVSAQAYSQTLAASGGQPPYTWSLASGTLPDGLSLSASGVVSGTPTTAGTSSFTVQVTDGTQTATGGLSIAVVDPLTVTTSSLPGGTVGQPYSQTLAASGGTTPYSWTVSVGSLPAGLSLDASTGMISGTPTTPNAVSFTASVTDGVQTDTQALSITVAAVPFATAVQSGTVRSGNAANLALDDDAYFEASSTRKGTRTSDWYGRFGGVSNSLTNLRVNYTGKNSLPCTQTVAIWRWTTSSWVQLDSRTVGAAEVAIASLAPAGTLGDYVSGATGDGEARVRIRCQTKAAAFFSSGDKLTLTYTR